MSTKRKSGRKARPDKPLARMMTVREMQIRQATPAAHAAVEVLVRRRNETVGLNVETESHYARMAFRWIGAAGVPRGYPDEIADLLAANGT